MTFRWQSFLTVILAGAFVAWIFALFGQGFQTTPEILIGLATVKGTLLAIVISVFLLSIQVNASEFSPLILEQISGSNSLTVLILVYLGSILVDILYVVSLTANFLVLPTSLNLSLGIPVGLSVICFLTLIPVHKEMVDLVSPERVLKTAESNAVREKHPPDKEKYFENYPRISPPNRTPLLSIEQVLITSDKGGDEFTVRKSIFHMYRAINSIIDDLDSSEDPDELDGLFEYWKSSIEIGKKGGDDRLKMLISAHYNIIESLVSTGHVNKADNQLNELHDIYEEAISRSLFSNKLFHPLQYILETAIENNSTGFIESIFSTVFSSLELLLSHGIKEGEYPQELAGERRDLFGNGLELTVKMLETIAVSDEIKQDTLRRVSNNAIQEISVIVTNLSDSLAEFDDEPESQGIVQNVYRDLQKGIISGLENIYSSDEVVGKMLGIAILELAICLDQDSNQLNSALNDKIENEILATLLKDMGEVEAPSTLGNLCGREERSTAEYLERLINLN